MSISINVLTITDNSGTINSMAYVANSANVTSGQDNSPPPTVQKTGNVFTITFACDRKKSAPVATAFNNNCNNNSLNAYAASGGGGLPKELNFFFQLELQVTTASGSGSASSQCIADPPEDALGRDQDDHDDGDRIDNTLDARQHMAELAMQDLGKRHQHRRTTVGQPAHVLGLVVLGRTRPRHEQRGHSDRRYLADRAGSPAAHEQVSRRVDRRHPLLETNHVVHDAARAIPSGWHVVHKALAAQMPDCNIAEIGRAHV